MTLRSLRDRAETLWLGGRKTRLAVPGVRARLDPTLLLLVVTLVIAFGTAGFWGAAYERARGVFDPPLLRPAPERRILSDFRASNVPFVDGIMADNRTALLARADGSMVRYDTATELFDEESIPRGAGLSGDISLLAASCSATEHEACPYENEVFAVSDLGGLARRDGAGRWSVVLGDDAWLGRDGLAVEQADVETWAVSDDGRWMLASAGVRGLGLFDQRTGTWATLPGAASPPLQIRFVGGAFWLAGPGGLDRLVPGRSAMPEAIAGIRGEILDLAPDPNGLLALQRANCAINATPGCLSILRVSVSGAVRRLVGEDELNASLSNASLRHAAMQNGRLVVLGGSGVHVYDPGQRSWRTLDSTPVDAFHAGPEGRVIHIASGLKLRRLANAAFSEERDLETPLVQVLPGPGRGLLGLDTAGRVLDLAQASPVTLFHSDNGLPDGARFTTGAVSGNTLILFGPAGVLLHDTRERRYAFQNANTLPQPVTRLAAPRLFADGAIWLSDMETGDVFIGRLEGDWPQRRIVFERALDPAAPPLGRLRGAQAAARNLHVVTQAGRPFSATAGRAGFVSLVGAPLPEAISPRAVTGNQNGLILADGGRLWQYLFVGPAGGENRNWDGPFRGPGGEIAELAIGAGVYALGTSTELFRLLEGNRWASVSGGGPGAAMSSGMLSDATAAGGLLYLGGNGRVQVYDPANRGFAEPFSGGNGSVRIVEAGRQPIWHSGSRLFRGNSLASRDGEAVLGAWTSPDGPIYLGRSDNQRLYAATLDGRCLFRGTPAPEGELVDARALPDGRVLALTSRGAGLHDAANRRWIFLPGEAASPETRIEILGDYLVRKDGNALRALPLAEIPTVASCDANPQRLGWTFSTRPDHFSVDTDTGTILTLQNGEVREWRNGSQLLLLPSPSQAPATSGLRRPAAQGGRWAFVSASAVWRYDLGQRIWTSAPILRGLSSPAELDMTLAADGRALITQWDRDGRTLGGFEAESGQGTARIGLNPLALPKLPVIGQPRGNIRDMATSGDRVAVLGQSVLELYRTSDMARQATVSLESLGAGLQNGLFSTSEVLVLFEGTGDRPTRMHVFSDSRLLRERVSLADVAWSYSPGTDRAWAVEDGRVLWRIDRDLVLWRCEVRIGRGAPDGCNIAAAAPLELKGHDLLAAEEANNERIVLTRGELLRLGPDLRLLARLATGLGEDARLFSHNEINYLWEGSGKPLSRIATGGLVAIGSAVTALRSRSGQLVVTEAETTSLLEDGVLRGRAELSSLSVTSDGEIWGIDDDGQARRSGFSSESGEDLMLRFDVESRAILPGRLRKDSGEIEGFWLQTADGSVQFKYMSQCPAPAEEMTTPKDDNETKTPEAETETPSDPGSEAISDEISAANEAPKAPLSSESASNDVDPVAVDPASAADSATEVEVTGTGTGTETDETAPDLESIDAGQEPATISCQQSLALQVTMTPGERLLEFVGTTSAPELMTDRRRLTIDPEGATVVGEAALGTLFPETSRSAQQRSDLERRIAIVDGVSLLAPPAIRDLQSGSVAVEGPVEALRITASTGVMPWMPFDNGWLRWDRSSGDFLFGGGAGVLRLEPSQAIDAEGRFIAVVPGRGAYLGGEDFSFINPHGLWRVVNGHSVQPVTQEEFWPVTGLAHGRFLQRGRGIDSRSGTITSDDDRLILSSGGLQVYENLRSGDVRATLEVSGQPVSAFSGRGFIFDQRIAAARLGRRAMILTPLGLVSASDFSGALEVPLGSDDLANESGALFVRVGLGNWRQIDPAGALRPADPPGATKQLAIVEGRQWGRRDGRAYVAPAIPAEAWRTAGTGLNFDSDRLVALAADRRGIVAVTGLGTATANRFAGLADAREAAAPDPDVRTLDAQDFSPGQSVLWAETSQGRLVWDNAVMTWRTPVSDAMPWAGRLAADLAGIRISFTGSRASPELQMRSVGGVLSQPFDWPFGGRMPFDRVRSFHTEAGVLLLATDFGLRRLLERGDEIVNDGIFALAGRTLTVQPISRVGRPAQDPRKIQAVDGAGGCISFATAGGVPGACVFGAILRDRLAVDTQFWRWTEGPSGVAAIYRLGDGGDLPIRLPIRGSLPHDRLAARAVCDGIEFELWAGAPVVTRFSAGLPGQLDLVGDSTSLHCQRRSAMLGGGESLPEGLLALGVGQGHHANSAGWTGLSSGQLRALEERAEGGVPWERDRLRIRLGNGLLRSEYRARNDTWRTLPWIDGRISVDVTRGLSTSGGGVQRLTPAGYAGLGTMAAQPRLDSDQLRLVTPDDPTSLEDCTADRLETQDGSVQSLGARPGDAVVLRCTDGRVFSGQPGGQQDAGGVQPLGRDPFVSRVLVDEPGFWTWRLEGAQAGRSGALEADFKGEKLVLNGGRLSVDTWKGIAAPFAETIDAVTEVGWWRAPAGNLSLVAMTRPTDFERPDHVTKLTSDRDPDNRAVLCAQIGAIARTVDTTGRSRNVERCLEWLGADPVWTWRQAETGPEASTTARNGVAAQRRLEAGRFIDLIITAAPTTDRDGSILAPTRLGALRIVDTGPSEIWAYLESGAAFQSASGLPFIVTKQGISALGDDADAPCTAISEMLGRLDSDAAVLRVRGDAAAVKVLVRQGLEKVELSVPCADFQSSLVWSQALDVSDRARFLALAVSWPGRSPLLLVSADPAGASLRITADRGRLLPQLDGSAVRAVLAPRDGRAVLILTEDDLFRLDTDRAIRELSQGTAPVPPLRGPFVRTAAESVSPHPTPPRPPAQPRRPDPSAEAARIEGPVPPQPAVPREQTTPSAAPPDAIPSGSSSDQEIRDLSRAEARVAQRRLADIGLYSSAIDGIIGPISRRAIRAWQAANGHEASGQLTNSQYFALIRGSSE